MKIELIFTERNNKNHECLHGLHSTPTGQILVVFLFPKMYYILLILNKYEKVIISQLRIDKPEHISHLNRRDKQVATDAAISAFGCAVSQADTVSSFLGHCYHISICLFLDQSSDSHSTRPPSCLKDHAVTYLL